MTFGGREVVNMEFVRQLAARAAQGPDTTPGAPVAPDGPPDGLELPPFSTDFEYPYSSLQHTGIALLFLFPALAFIVVTLRLYTRLITKQFGWDDVFICLAMANSAASSAVSYVGMRKSFLGVHAYDIPLEADPRIGMKWAYFIQALYNPILALVKTSLLLFLLRLSGQVQSIRWSIHALNAFNLALMVAIFITVLFQCTPISYFWEELGRNPPTEGFCIDKGAFYVSTAALTAFTDILVLALPFWIFLGLQMRRRVKWALVGIFALGGIVTIFSILRLVWLVDTFYGPPPADPTYDLRFIYSAVETNLAIIAASAPVLRGLFGLWFPKMFASFGGSKRSYTDGSKSHHPSQSGTGSQGSRHIETFHMKNVKTRSEIRSYSPSGSEEEIMTYNGIIRTREVDVSYDHNPETAHDMNTSSYQHEDTETISETGRTHRGVAV